ncbi:MAG TPA: protein kinase [Anaerolineae bacterium]
MNLTGQYLGKYKIIERLGQGAMAQVYKAHQPTIDRLVAIKVMHPHLAESADFVERFKREARGLGQLHHPHIVSVLDFEAVDDQYFMVMDYIAGPTLHDYLQQHGALPIVEALDIAGQLADALAYAHQQDIIHRDLKPGNVMFLDGSAQHAILTDFGLVRLLDSASLTMSGTAAGTPAYMSPEAARGERVDARSDIYSLGVVMYEMVTGQTLYTGENALSMMIQHLNESLPPLRETHPELPEAVIQLIERALAKEVDARFQDAAELGRAIRQARAVVENDGILPTMLLNTEVDRAPALGTAVTPAPRPDPVAANGRLTSQAAGLEPVKTKGRSRRLWAGSVVVLILLSLGLVWSNGSVNQDEAENVIPYTDSERFGVIRFSGDDDEQQLSLRLDRVAAPAAGSHYEGWIRTNDGQIVHLGTLPFADGRIQTTIPLGAAGNLPARFDTALISVETDGSTVLVPSDQIAFRGSLEPAFVDELGQLFLASGEATSKGYFPAAVEQTSLAIQHNDMLMEALTANHLDEAKLHAEHIINILDGENGRFFGDLDGDGQAQNPGDGVGVRTYLTQANAHIETAAQVLPPTAVRQTQAGQATAANNHALALLDKAVSAASQLIAADSVAEAKNTTLQIAIPLVELFNGSDLDGSGAIEVERGEGAMLAAAERVFALAEVSLRADTAQPAVPPPDPVADGSGRLGVFRLAPNNTFICQLDQVVATTDGVYYTLWGHNPATNALDPLAHFTAPDGSATIAGQTEQDLMATYDSLVISREADRAAETTVSNDILLGGVFDPDLVATVVRLTGSSIDAQAQINLAIDHATLMQDALAAGTLAEARLHAEHVVNILDGENGRFFGDLDGDGQAQNPGNGVGVRGYLTATVEQVQAMESGLELSGDQQFLAGQLVTLSEANLATIDAAIEQARKVVAADSVVEAQPQAGAAGRLLAALLTGIDSNEDSVIDPLRDEGGVAILSQLALSLVEVDLMP